MKEFSPYPLCALAAIGGGVLRIGSVALDWSTMTPELEIFALVIDFSLLFGLAGFYFANAGRLGVFGFIGSFIAALGLASITGPDGVFYGVDVYKVGAQVIGVGLLLFGVALILKNVARLAGIAWILSAAASVIGGMVGPGALGFQIAGVLFALGFIAAGASLYSMQRS